MEIVPGAEDTWQGEIVHAEDLGSGHFLFADIGKQERCWFVSPASCRAYSAAPPAPRRVDLAPSDLRTEFAAQIAKTAPHHVTGITTQELAPPKTRGPDSGYSYPAVLKIERIRKRQPLCPDLASRNGQ
ncbi:hypothetical protein [Cribrihabitans pelagius]|uniref:hypothetical protein n=1 Tax=Cribrihabitans pelagius TaxID=1765746 RepID=UPI003B5A717E